MKPHLFILYDFLGSFLCFLFFPGMYSRSTIHTFQIVLTCLSSSRVGVVDQLYALLSHCHYAIMLWPRFDLVPLCLAKLDFKGESKSATKR